MHSRYVALALTAVLCVATLARAQAPTPTPVDSNVAVSSFAQSRGNPCTTTGGNGCGGCYPAPIPGGDVTSELSKVNPEWQPISPMIDLGSSTPADPSLPPLSAPVLINGTVALSKINTGGDFPASHITTDQNTFIELDAADNGRLASGNNSDTTECPGENCNRIEMEWEVGKYPLFAWAGEGDRVMAIGRWVFDCGHPDPDPGHCSVPTVRACTDDSDCSTSETCESGFCTAKCISDADCPSGGTCEGGIGGCTSLDSGSNTVRCIIASDCSGSCNSGHCSNDAAQTCAANSDCNFGSCNNPDPNFNFRAELHPPQAVVVLRDKGLPPGIPATRADVYLSGDGGGAGDSCIVSHLASAGSLLTSKVCFPLGHPLASVTAPDFNHCSSTARHCAIDADCPALETCIATPNFEFDMPLPPPPPLTPTPILKTKFKKFPQKKGQAPKPTLQLVMAPTPHLHVVIPMTSTLPNGNTPNVFAGSISAGWKGDTTTPMEHVLVKFKSLTINNPLKERVPAVPKQCKGFVGLSGLPCASNSDCLSGNCMAGLTPGWTVFGQVNGDWVQFKRLNTIGAAAPFLAPPFLVPSPTPLVIPQANTFNQWVRADGQIHIATTGMSLNCLDRLYGADVKTDLTLWGINAGATCLSGGDHDPGAVDVTLNGPSFMPPTPPPGVTPSVVCTPAAGATPANCFATSGEGEGGHCSVTTNKLCVNDEDCPGQCTGGSAATGDRSCMTNADCKHCSITTTQACASDMDCPAGTCSGSKWPCHQSADCPSGQSCNTATQETCVADSGATCSGAETCMGACSNDQTHICHTDADCGAGNSCVFGGAVTLQYTIQLK